VSTLLRFMSPLSVHPWLAVAIAAGLGFLARRVRLVWLGMVAGVWVVYAFYELSIHYHLICSRECDIRLDLLLIYPLLASITLLGLIQLAVTMWRRREGAPAR